MQTIRTFIAVPLSPEIERAAIRLIDQLSAEGDGIKWVPTESLHLTLKFLGDVDNTEVPAICEVIRSATEQLEPFELDFFGLGAFPSLDRPRVIHVGITDDSGYLCQLVSKLETDLADLGFKPEPRDYRPHLTLGRTKGSRKKASDILTAQIESLGQVDVGAMVVDHVQLVASFLDKHGPTYQVMDTVDI